MGEFVRGSRIAPIGSPTRFHEIRLFRAAPSVTDAKDALVRHFPELATAAYDVRITRHSERVYTYTVHPARQSPVTITVDEEERVA